MKTTSFEICDASHIVGLGGFLGADCSADADLANEYHGKAKKSYQSFRKFAMLAGKALLRVRKKAKYGQWLPWLKQNCPNISKWTAAHYMRLAREWNPMQSEVDDLSYRETLKAMRQQRKGGRRFDADDLLHSQIFKAFLRVACKDWTREDFDDLKHGAKWDPELQALCIEAMKPIKWAIRRNGERLTKLDRREQCKGAWDRWQLWQTAQRVALDEHSANKKEVQKRGKKASTHNREAH